MYVNIIYDSPIYAWSHVWPSLVWHYRLHHRLGLSYTSVAVVFALLLVAVVGVVEYLVPWQSEVPVSALYAHMYIHMYCMYIYVLCMYYLYSILYMMHSNRICIMHLWYNAYIVMQCILNFVWPKSTPFQFQVFFLMQVSSAGVHLLQQRSWSPIWTGTHVHALTLIEFMYVWTWITDSSWKFSPCV